MSQLRFRTIRARGVAALARGTAVVGHLVAPGSDEVRGQLKSANAEVRRLQAEVTKEHRAVERLKKELRATRTSLIDPIPGLELPEHVGLAIDRARSEHLTYLGVRQLTVLARQVYDADLSGREGLIIEAGTARGGSAIAMAAAKDPDRPMKVYDVFGQIPPPTDEDGTDVHDRYQTISEGDARGIGGDTYYGYRDNLYGEVAESFARLGVPVDENNVELVKGLFEDTMHIDGPVAFAHLDGDWYSSTMTCLERIAPFLVKGGRIVFDDYFHWSGCRKAVDDYFAHRTGYQLERRNKVHVVKL